MIRSAIHTTFRVRSARRFARWPLALTLVLGLLLSLLHCAGCDLAFAGSDPQTIATSADTGPDADRPDQPLSIHCGHCLRHVTAQPTAILALPANLAMPALVSAEQTAPGLLAGLLPFKPPRT